jgi:hypothetical protein
MACSPIAEDDGIMARPCESGGDLVEFQPMSPEDIERIVHFLLHQQAQFAADFEKLSAKTDRIADGVIGLTGIVGRLATAQDRTDQQLNDTKTRLDDLGQYIKTVESHWNVVIRMFERRLGEDHGHPTS